MKINIICNQTKKENKYIKPFVEFYLSSYFPKIKKLDIDCPDKNNHQKAPDYFLNQPKIAVEIKEVHEREELKRSKSNVYSVKRLQKELDKCVKNSKFSKGLYSLNYPWNLKIKRGQEGKIAQSIINAIRKNDKNIFIKGIGNFKVISKPKEKKDKILLFSSMSPTMLIDPAGTIHQNIGSKIKKANKQLEKIKANKKILLLANKYSDGEEINEFIEALSYSYKELLTCKNINEIWLQIERATGQFYHNLLYKNDFLNSFDKSSFKSITHDEINLLEEWFYPLSKLGDDYKNKLFIALKQILKDKKPYEVFDNKFAREEMVQLGIWLVEKKRFNDSIWIIDKFIDDPDPEEPEKYSSDPKLNYHQQIIDGEDPHIITTVLGHLAWVVKKIAVYKNYIVKALDYTKKLLSHKNLYVKLQAIIPLIEISARRQWLQGWGKRPREGQYKEFHKIVFDLLNLVKENPNYKAIAKRLWHVFVYYKDLSTSEAEQVLSALKITDESAALFVYFGFFRQRHYKDQNIEYNGQRLEKKLKEIIKNKKENYQQLRAKIAWHLWKVLDQNRNEFETIQPYIDLILKQPYQRDIYNKILIIINDWIKDKPDICTLWYKKILLNISNFVKNTKGLRAQGGLWLIYTEHTEKIVETIAQHKPNDLLEVIENLIFLWKKGVFVGNLKRLFGSYKLLSAGNQKIEIKNKFQKLYNSMIKLNPKIEIVNWD